MYYYYIKHGSGCTTIVYCIKSYFEQTEFGLQKFLSKFYVHSIVASLFSFLPIQLLNLFSYFVRQLNKNWCTLPFCNG